jgi:ABC-type uncharacterized transport system fused permease/ATPase subunit
MFKKLKIFKEAGIKLYPYFTPSYDNCVRTIGYLVGLVVVPVVNYLIPNLFLKKNSELEKENSNNFDITTALTSVAAVALFNGLQQSLSTMLATSTMQAMKKRNTQQLMDEECHFLINGNLNGNYENLKSLQYITVGVGPRDFAWCAVPMFFSLPMYLATLVTTLLNIGTATGSFKASGVTLIFITTSAVGIYISNKEYFSYEANNQKIENDLVAKIAFIEANRSSIQLIGASSAECTSIIQNLQKVNSSIPKLSLLNFSSILIASLSTTIASQFLGGYYKDNSIQDINDSNAKVLNVMLMSLITNIIDIVRILTANYSFVELNLEQLNAFDEAYNNCLLTRKAHKKMQQKFEGNHFSLLDFCVDIPDPRDPLNIKLITLLNKVTLRLPPNKVYKLSAESGNGKTTFLKAITDNWPYTDGIVTFPANAKKNICFIPQDSFVPKGTLLEILAYPLKFQEFKNDSMFPYSKKTKLYSPINDDDDDDKIICSFINKAEELLIKTGLMPKVIRHDELELEGINWEKLLSGGEKQKIGIIRALLANDSQFIIMDEATSALDTKNKQIVYEVVKKHVANLKDYIIIYTDHSYEATASFADAILHLSGQNIEYHDFL